MEIINQTENITAAAGNILINTILFTPGGDDDFDADWDDEEDENFDDLMAPETDLHKLKDDEGWGEIDEDDDDHLPDDDLQ